MDFLDVRSRLVQNFQRAAAEKPLFQVALNQRELWALYLNSFPEGTNPLYRTRREYDCNCCRHFFDAAGSIVYIDGQLTLHSLFDFDAGDPAFQQVMDVLDAFVKAHPIAGPYISTSDQAGVAQSPCVDEQGDVHIWRHFFLPLPPQAVILWPPEANAAKARARADYQVFKRSLGEITLEAVDTVLELIHSHALYRGKEWEAWNRTRREAVKRVKEADVFRAIRARIQKRRMNEYER